MAHNAQHAQHKNIARKKSVTPDGAAAVANKQIWQREFKDDYNQIMKRVSSAVFDGLRFGAVPPTVQ